MHNRWVPYNIMDYIPVPNENTGPLWEGLQVGKLHMSPLIDGKTKRYKGNWHLDILSWKRYFIHSIVAFLWSSEGATSISWIHT